MKTGTCFTLLFFFSLSLFPQSNIQQTLSVNTDGSAPNPSAQLDVSATDKGMLVPRMTTAQRTAILPAATGLLVFDTTTGSFWFYNGLAWSDLSSPKLLADADGNTSIQVEQNTNEDVIRMTLAGNERFTIQKNTPYNHTQLLLPDNGSNIFLGNHAGDSTSTGIQNLFLGENAGRRNTTGSGNILLGFAAGEMGLAAYSNTFVGYETGRNNITGDNTFVGYFAGKATTTGAENTFLGSFAGVSNITGSSNTFLGRFAGQFNQSGVFNTYIGHGAGSLNTSGFNNVYLGSNAGALSQGSNQLFIENSAAGSGNALIYGEFDADLLRLNGKVGISRTPLTNILEVEGNASKTTAGEWAANSDARLKKNITPLNSEEMLQKMLALRGITYEWADDVTGSQRPEGTMYGFTAQNIREVFPTFVEEDKLGYLQTAYGTYDAMTVEAIRALNDKIEAQQTEIERLKKMEAHLEKITATLPGAGIAVEK